MSAAEQPAGVEPPSLAMRQFDCTGGRYLRVDRHGLLWRVAYYEPRTRANKEKYLARFSCADRDLGFALARVLTESDSALFSEPLIAYIRNKMEDAL